MTPQVTISISMDEKGQVFITGPIENKILCFGLLRMAEQIVSDFKPSPIVQPTNGDVERINKAN